MKTGTIVRGVVTKMEPYGVFVREEISDVRMLLHHSQVSWARGLDVKSLLNIGDEVYAMIGKIEQHKFDSSNDKGGVRVELLTNVLERVQGEISSAQKLKDVMSQARERVAEYRYVRRKKRTHKHC